MTLTADNAKPKRRKAQPLPRPPEPKGKGKPLKTRELKPASPGNYVTKGSPAPGDDDGEGFETPRRKS